MFMLLQGVVVVPVLVYIWSSVVGLLLFLEVNKNFFGQKYLIQIFLERRFLSFWMRWTRPKQLFLIISELYIAWQSWLQLVIVLFCSIGVRQPWKLQKYKYHSYDKQTNNLWTCIHPTSLPPLSNLNNFFCQPSCITCIFTHFQVILFPTINRNEYRQHETWITQTLFIKSLGYHNMKHELHRHCWFSIENILYWLIRPIASLNIILKIFHFILYIWVFLFGRYLILLFFLFYWKDRKSYKFWFWKGHNVFLHHQELNILVHINLDRYCCRQKIHRYLFFIFSIPSGLIMEFQTILWLCVKFWKDYTICHQILAQ